MNDTTTGASLEQLTGELRNFQSIATEIVPRSGDIPILEGIDIYGNTIPLNGVVGGDHIIYVDFKRRYDLDARIQSAVNDGKADVAKALECCRKRGGIAIVDVSGHNETDALLAAMLHQAFLLGALYEMDIYGEITRRLFENLNTRMYNSSSGGKFATMIYGEIRTDGTFKFLSAGHPPPLVFSNLHNRFMEIGKDLCATFPPLGTLPSENVIDRITTESVLGFKSDYILNRWELMGAGDILLLYTDGLIDHSGEEGQYFRLHLEEKMQSIKHASAHEIYDAITTDMLAWAPPSDDISIVVVKRS